MTRLHSVDIVQVPDFSILPQIQTRALMIGLCHDIAELLTEHRCQYLERFRSVINDQSRE